MEEGGEGKSSGRGERERVVGGERDERERESSGRGG